MLKFFSETANCVVKSCDEEERESAKQILNLPLGFKKINKIHKSVSISD